MAAKEVGKDCEVSSYMPVCHACLGISQMHCNFAQIKHLGYVS